MTLGTVAFIHIGQHITNDVSEVREEIKGIVVIVVVFYVALFGGGGNSSQRTGNEVAKND